MSARIHSNYVAQIVDKATVRINLNYDSRPNLTFYATHLGIFFLFGLFLVVCNNFMSDVVWDVFLLLLLLSLSLSRLNRVSSYTLIDRTKSSRQIL